MRPPSTSRAFIFSWRNEPSRGETGGTSDVRATVTLCAVVAPVLDSAAPRGARADAVDRPLAAAARADAPDRPPSPAGDRRRRRAPGRRQERHRLEPGRGDRGARPAGGGRRPGHRRPPPARTLRRRGRPKRSRGRPACATYDSGRPRRCANGPATTRPGVASSTGSDSWTPTSSSSTSPTPTATTCGTSSVPAPNACWCRPAIARRWRRPTLSCMRQPFAPSGGMAPARARCWRDSREAWWETSRRPPRTPSPFTPSRASCAGSSGSRSPRSDVCAKARGSSNRSRRRSRSAPAGGSTTRCVRSTRSRSW